jgi:hypothetical protein
MSGISTPRDWRDGHVLRDAGVALSYRRSLSWPDLFRPSTPLNGKRGHDDFI